MTSRFLVTRGPGAAWDPNRPTREQAGWDPHAEFMDGLADERFVAFGGPAGSRNQVVLVVDAPDPATVRARLALDPWTGSDHLRTLAIEPWAIWLGADERVEAAPGATLFLVAYAPGPDWEDAKPRRQQAGWDAHGEFMDELVDQAVVLLGGPLDARRAVLVMQHEAEDSLRQVLAADPWYGGVLRIESIEPWTLWLVQPQPGA